MKCFRKKDGFTLVELMVTIAAAAILTLISATLMIIGFQAWRTDNVYVDLRRDSAYAFTLLSRDVRESNYSGLADGAGYLGTTRGWDGNQTITYQQVGDTLQYDEGNGVVTVIPANVQHFSSQKIPDGNGVELILALSREGIAVTNEVFISARN